MAEGSKSIVRSELRSPRSAAIAGIIYSLLMTVGMLLIAGLVNIRPENITWKSLETWSSTSTLVLTLVPFAGIALLWFTGVIRDRMGEHEDQFFATIFLGSGIIQVLLLFIWGAVFGAILGTRALAATGVLDDSVYIFGFVLMSQILGNYGVRISGIYVTAIGTIWYRTGSMPRWLTVISFLLAIGFLLGAPRISEARFIFPAWVFVVSVYILVLNFRRTQDEDSNSGVIPGGN